MRMKFLVLSRLLIVTVFLLNACGSDDYGPDHSEQGKTAQGKPEQKVPPPATGQMSMIEQREARTGFIWQGLGWLGLNDGMVSDFKSRLADDKQTNPFCTFGASVLGGAVLGLVVRASGSWFFGGPVEPKPGHWFWNSLNKTVQSGGRGILRGGLFGGGCYLLLTGLSPLPFSGLLGQSFRALSSSIVLGGMSLGAASPFIRRMIGKDWTDTESPIGKALSRTKWTRQGAEKFQHWSESTEIGEGIRYRVIPGLVILGIGAGIGMLIYESCSGEDACAGNQVAGSCWYKGWLSTSCTSVCEPHGGVNDATINIAGSGGTNQACQDVVTSFGLQHPSAVVNTCPAQVSNMGCTMNFLMSDIERCEAPTDTNASTTFGSGLFAHFCACNK